MAFWLQLVVSLALSVLAYALTPKPKQAKPPAAQDLQDPTADAGRPIPVVFGTITVQGVNVLWFGEKRSRTYQVNA